MATESPPPTEPQAGPCVPHDTPSTALVSQLPRRLWQEMVVFARLCGAWLSTCQSFNTWAQGAQEAVKQCLASEFRDHLGAADVSHREQKLRKIASNTVTH